MGNTVTKYYRGLDEVREITWNSVNANREKVLRIYEMVYASLNEMFTETESTALRERFVANGIHILELTNAAYVDRVIDVAGFHDIEEVRYINPKLITYQTEIIIYDDVVAFYDYDQEAHGVEIYNKEFADTQKQIFDQLWRKASLPIIGPHGRSSMI